MMKNSLEMVTEDKFELNIKITEIIGTTIRI